MKSSKRSACNSWLYFLRLVIVLVIISGIMTVTLSLIFEWRNKTLLDEGFAVCRETFNDCRLQECFAAQYPVSWKEHWEYVRARDDCLLVTK